MSEKLFFVGKKFKSYDELEGIIEKYSSKKFVQMYKTDGRTLTGAAVKIKRISTQLIPKSLIYYSLKFACIQGGRDYISTSKGLRPNQKTFRIRCPFNIKLLLAQDGQSLNVVGMNEKHNHPVNRKLFQHLPKQRRLGPKTMVFAENYLKLKGDRKLLREFLVKNCKKNVSIQDIHNINARISKTTDLETTNLNKLVKDLQKDKGTTVELLIDDENIFQALFFQDGTMKRMYRAYPEVLIFDGTYKLKNLDMTLFILFCVDGNGESDFVAGFLLAQETSDNFQSMLKSFKKYNRNYEETNYIFIDKDLTYRNIIHEEFPKSELSLCLFQIFRIFRKEISIEKMGITNELKECYLDLLQKMSHCRTEEDYQQLFKILISMKSLKVRRYFKNNWHNIRIDWCFRDFDHQNCANQRMEFLNKKMETLCSKFVSLNQFFDDFSILLKTLNKEKDEQAANFVLKVQALNSIRGSDEEQYSQQLTTYALKLVSENFSKRNQVKLVEDSKNFGFFKSNDSFVVSSNECDCPFFKNSRLPCEHLLVCRDTLDLPVFEKALIPLRWRNEYYYQSREENFHEKYSRNGVLENLNNREKYQKATAKIENIASKLSKSPMDLFENYMRALNKIENAIKRNETVEVSTSECRIGTEMDTSEPQFEVLLDYIN